MPGNEQTYTVNWAFAFPDTNYTVTCTPQTPGSFNVNFWTFQVSAVNTSSVSVDVAANVYGNGPFPTNFTINCIGIHDTMTVSNNPSLVSIAVTPTSFLLAPNTTQQYTATGTYSDGSTKDITSSVSWNATPGATITSGGLATAVFPNAITITATQGNITGTVRGSVTDDPSLVSIAVTPTNVSVPVGSTQQYTATGTYRDGSTKDITNSVFWNATPPAGATITSGGLATAVSPSNGGCIDAVQGVQHPIYSNCAMMTVTSP
jgi:hypothetical protein